MSRSFRKPIVTDGQRQRKGRGRSWRKRHSNKVIRRKLNRSDFKIADGCAYRNGAGVSSWDICDFKFRIDKPLTTKLIGICSEKVDIKAYKERLRNYLKAKRK